MEGASVGKIIIVIGIAMIVFGAIVLLFSRLTGGRGAPLPGDIVIRKDHVTIYFPIVTGIVVSIILTLMLWAIAAFRK
jgi:hypothetical protein